MSYNSNPDQNGNRNRNRRRRNRNDRNDAEFSPSGNGSRAAYKTLDERSGMEKFLNKISFGILCKPKSKSRPQQPKTNVTVVGSGSGPRPARADGGPPRTPREPRAPREYVPATPAEVTTERLYVGNLSYDAAESDLVELFQGVGAVRSAEVVVHSRTQRSKGFAFVTMGSVDEAKRAVLELTNKEFMGRPLQLSGAKPSNRGDREERGERDERPSREEQAERAEAEAAMSA